MRKPKAPILAQLGLLLGTSLFIVGCGGSSSDTPAPPVNLNDAALKFVPANAAPNTLTVTVDGEEMSVTRYKVCYVAKPIEALPLQPNLGPPVDLTGDLYSAQSMYVYVPETVASSQTAPIYLRVNNSGWHSQPLAAQTPMIVDGGEYDSTADADPSGQGAPSTASMGAALKAGYVIVQAGTRSRGFTAADSTLAGKAPAPAVDTKAAIRYLRLNDSIMPGSAERIILTGTSGGGGLTSVVAASGNSADYYPYLAEIGAAGIMTSGAAHTSTLKDDVFAAVAYCPINNFANVDAGYEWQFNAARNSSNTGSIGGVAYGAEGDRQSEASDAIKEDFAPYLNGLKLKIDEEGTLLTASNMPGVITNLMKEEIERQIAAGVTMPVNGVGTFTANGATLTNDWLTTVGTGYSAEVTDLDYTKFVSFVAASKALKYVVAFDSTGVTGASVAMGQGESNMFGTATQPYCNYIKWTWENNNLAEDGIGQDDTGYTWAQFLTRSEGANIAEQLKLISAVDYLTASGTTVTPHWYVRHGMVDRDTGFAMQALLYYAIKNNPSVQDVSFKFPYMTGHAGNYDVQEAFAWIDKRVKENPLN